MKNINRYKLTFGEKTLTLTTDKDNLFMEEVDRVAKENIRPSRSVYQKQTTKLLQF